MGLLTDVFNHDFVVVLQCWLCPAIDGFHAEELCHLQATVRYSSLINIEQGVLLYWAYDCFPPNFRIVSMAMEK